EVVGFPRDQLMHFKSALGDSRMNEAVDFAVRVAGNVGEYGVSAGPLCQPLNRHDGKQLADGPAVRQGLEHRKVAEVDVAQHLLEVFQLFGNTIELAA